MHERSSGPRDEWGGTSQWSRHNLLTMTVSLNRRPGPNGPRAGVQHAAEDITRIGRGIVIEGEVKGGEGSRHRRQGRRDDRAAATWPDSRTNRQGQGAVVGEVGRGSRRGERDHPGERAGAHRRDRLCRRRGLCSAVGHRGRSPVAGSRGHVGRMTSAEHPCVCRCRSIRPTRPRLWKTLIAQGVLAKSRRHARGRGGRSPRQPHSRPTGSPTVSGLRCCRVNLPTRWDRSPAALPRSSLTSFSRSPRRSRSLSLCEHDGSQHLVLKLVAVGCGTGVPGLPEATTGRCWNAGQMRAAVTHLEHLRVR